MTGARLVCIRICFLSVFAANYGRFLAILTSLQENGAFTGVMALPSFHTFGIYSQIYGPLRGGYPVAMFAPQAPASPVVPNPRNVLDVAKALSCDSRVIVPALIEVKCHRIAISLRR